MFYYQTGSIGFGEKTGMNSENRENRGHKMRIVLTIMFSLTASMCFAEFYDDEVAEKIFKKGEVIAGGFGKAGYRVLIKYKKEYYDCMASVDDNGLNVWWCQGK